MCGICVFGNALPAQPIRHVLRQVEPRRAGNLPCQFIRVELIQRIQAEQLNAGQRIEPRWSNNLMDFLFGFLRSFIPVAERIRTRTPILIQANIVDRPSIHANGRDSFGRGLGAKAHAAHDSIKNPADIPTEAFLRGHWAIRETIHHLNLRMTFFPSQERHTTTLCTQIHGDESCSFRRRFHRDRPRPPAPSCPHFHWTAALPEECFRKTAVHWNQMTRGAAGLRSRQKQNCGGTIFGVDGLMRQRPFGIKFR